MAKLPTNPKPKAKPKLSRPGSISAAQREANRELAESTGLTPLEFMLMEMRDARNLKNVRLTAARDAAPYVHPKLSSVVMKGDAKHPLTHSVVSTEEFEAAARKLLSEI